MTTNKKEKLDFKRIKNKEKGYYEAHKKEIFEYSVENAQLIQQLYAKQFIEQYRKEHPVLEEALSEIGKKKKISKKYIDYFVLHQALKGEINIPQEGEEGYITEDRREDD